MLHKFQNAKKTFYDKEQNHYNVELPFDFVGFIQDKLEKNDNEDAEDIEDFVCHNSKVFGQEKLRYLFL